MSDNYYLPPTLHQKAERHADFFLPGLLILFIGLIFMSSCNCHKDTNVTEIGRAPVIYPDYTNVTIPCNIAPLNFRMLEKGKSFHVNVKNSSGRELSVTSSDGTISFPLKSWRELISGSAGDTIRFIIISDNRKGELVKYDPFFIIVAKEPADPWLCYRLIYPGYESWSGMKIVQRSMESFRESSVIENQILDNDCINCHTFYRNDHRRFLIHARGSHAGTYIVNGDQVLRTELRTAEMPANAVYPSWHPSGKYIAFSSNKIVQAIHMRPERDNEFYDVISSLVIYDVENNEMSPCRQEDSSRYMETYPCWSPDGNYIYYCRTEQVGQGFDYRKVKYDIVKRSFDQLVGTFGPSQVVFDAHAINKSSSLPAVSPDGRYIVFTLHECGSFPVWHKEADLYLLDMNNGESELMSLNSSETESWHSWSANGKWLVFSSKRDDGLTSRPYLAYFNQGRTGKPFILPQKDPRIYERMTESFNRPEFVDGKTDVTSRDFELASKREAVKANWRK